VALLAFEALEALEALAACNILETALPNLDTYAAPAFAALPSLTILTKEVVVVAGAVPVF